MGMPVLLTQNATGTAGAAGIWQPDWMQNPFQIGYGVIATGGAETLVNLQFTLDELNGISTTTGLTWYTISSSLISTSGTFTTPCRGIRVNLVSSTSTTIVVVNLIQANYGGS